MPWDPSLGGSYVDSQQSLYKLRRESGSSFVGVFPVGVGTNFSVPVNNFSSVVGPGGYVAGSKSLTIASGDGSKLPHLDVGQYFRVTVIQNAFAYSPTATSSNYTIYKVTSVAGDSLLNLSVLEGTTDRNYAAGDVVQVRMTAGVASDIQKAVNAIEGSYPNLGLSLYSWLPSKDASSLNSYASGQLLPRTITARFSDTVNVLDFGAKGDYNGIQARSTDNTIPIQNCINYALANGCKEVYIPAGAYMITNTINVGDAYGSGPNRIGLRICGAGRTYEGYGGTYLDLVGTSFQAILQYNGTAWRNHYLSDLGLRCHTAGNATYGLLFNSTEYSAHTVERVNIDSPITAIGILIGTGANGEFINFHNINATGVYNFFFCNSGQAYNQSFHHCSCNFNPAQSTGNTNIAFQMLSLDGGNNSLGGGGINIFDFMGTYNHSYTPVSPSPPPNIGSSTSAGNTVFLNVQGNDSFVNVFGGRLEWVTQIYRGIGSTAALGCSVNFKGFQATCDNGGFYDPSVTVGAAVYVTTETDVILFDGCDIQSARIDSGTNVTQGVFETNIQNSSSMVRYRGCQFVNFLSVPECNTQFNDVHQSIVYEDCYTASGGNINTLANIPFGYSSESLTFPVGKRKGYSSSALVQSGPPNNILLQPSFGNVFGNTVAAALPWVGYTPAYPGTQTGGANITLRDWSFSGSLSAYYRMGSSPYARYIVFSPNTGQRQTLSSLDLFTFPSTDSVTYSEQGHNVHEITYQGLWTCLAGSVSLRFSLENAQTGQIYAEQRFDTSSGQTRGPKLITLVAFAPQTATHQNPMLRIENYDPSNGAFMTMAWQYVSVGGRDASFVQTGGSSSIISSEWWAASSESLRLWSRLALPHKSDSYGAAASPVQNDLGSDLYLSSDTERLTYYANGSWWAHPRQTTPASTTAPPTSGTWAVGDIVWRNPASSASPIGWICVTSGTPGAWQSMPSLGVTASAGNGPPTVKAAVENGSTYVDNVASKLYVMSAGEWQSVALTGKATPLAVGFWLTTFPDTVRPIKRDLGTVVSKVPFSIAGTFYEAG